MTKKKKVRRVVLGEGKIVEASFNVRRGKFFVGIEMDGFPAGDYRVCGNARITAEVIE